MRHRMVGLVAGLWLLAAGAIGAITVLLRAAGAGGLPRPRRQDRLRHRQP